MNYLQYRYLELNFQILDQVKISLSALIKNKKKNIKKSKTSNFYKQLRKNQNILKFMQRIVYKYYIINI